MTKNAARVLYVFSILAILLTQIGIMQVVAATTFFVNSALDKVDANPGDGICQTGTLGECTLRAAVQEANATPGTDTISIPAGIYTLGRVGANEDAAATGDLDITDAVIIQGTGMGQTVIDAGGLDRAFQVISGTLTISELTIQHGVANPGGGLLVGTSATITAVTFNANQSPSTLSDGAGGGVYVGTGATLTIGKSVFSGNSVNYGGGAVATAGGGAMFDIADSTFDSNYGGFGGGALYPNGGASIVRRSTFLNNSATETTGPGGSVGGAIHSNASSVLVENSTFVGNIAPHDGAIDARIGAITVNNSTFYNNQNVGSDQFGSTMGSQPANGGSIAVRNSILYGSATNNCSSVTDLGSNLSWPAGNNCPGLQVDPELSPLASNGGYTQTMAIPSSSHALDAGNNATCAATDQRGITRPQGAACDIGAFELSLDPVQSGPTFTVNVANDNNGACTLGDCSLREAILAANAAPNGAVADKIAFSLFNSHTISLASALPTITEAVAMDGTGVTLDGSNAGSGTAGLTLASSNNTIQGLEITGFSGAGIVVTGAGSTGNMLQGNSIHDNGGVGIDLGGDGASFNHLGTIAGPNAYQNYPILNLATSDGSSLRLVGILDAAPSSSYALDLYNSPSCDATSFGEGQTYLGTFQVTTDANGRAAFDHTIAAGANEPAVITATATGSQGTSEFSYCRPVATPNLNWVQAQAVANGSTTQQYFTDRFQEKWFKFPVQPGDTVTVTMTGQPGSAISLHSDPNAIYNALINPQSAAALSAEAADSAFLPSGSLPSGSLPSGSLPSGSLPSGSLETGYLPSGSLPSGSLPSGSLPSGSLPSGSLPSGSLPSGSLPSGSLPSGSLPSGSLPSGSLPSGSLPSGSLPSGSLPSGSLPSGSLPSGSLPSGSLPSGSLPSGSLDAYASAARRSLLGISMDPYAAVQTIQRATYDTSGDLYIRLVGPFSLTAPFKVQVTVGGGTCSGITSVPGNLQISNGQLPGGGFNTLILTDSGPNRLKGTSAEISQALTDLQAFAGRSDVNGAYINLGDTQYQRVAWANSQADAYPTCPAAKNMVATEIKAVIDQYRQASGSSLHYIVLAGGANVIPFYQIPDVAGLASEKDYVAPVAANSPSEAGFKTGLVQSQDFYGSQASLTQGGLTIALPDLAVGRLVDTAADISNAIQVYDAANGVVTPHSSLVTGYDFVGDAAAAIKTELDAGTASTADTLIEAPGLPSTDPTAWTAGQLYTKLLAGSHDVVVLTGHFSAGSLLAADYSSQLTAAGLAASSAPLSNVVVLALGCHGGYSIPNPDLLQQASPNPDWAKAFLAKGAAGYVSASGYAYGDTELTEYGERLFVSLTQQLRTGSGPVALGQALMQAKRQYIANTAQMTGIDQKTIAEMTLYGFPMMKVNMPGQRIPVPSESSIVNGTSAFSSGPGATAGLSRTTVTLAPAIHQNPPVTLTNLADNSTVQAVYLSGDDGVIANPYEPVYPKDIYDVSASGLVLRGVALYGGSYADQANVVPLTSAPTTETSVAHLSFNSSVFYPTQVWMPNFADALSGGATRLVAIPAQYQSSAPGAIDGTLRSFGQMKLKLYYMAADWPSNGSAAVKAAGVSAAPSILGASGVENNGSVNFSVNAAADGSASVQELWVLYTGKPGSPYYGQWTPLDLAQTANDPTRWEGSLTLQAGANSADLLFMVEAVGGAGLTTLSTNLGAYYGVTPQNAGQLPPPAATSISFQSPPSSGTYLKNSTFNVLLSAGTQPLANQLVQVSVGGQQGSALTDASGHASVTLKLVVPPGSYSANAGFPGNAQYLSAVAATAFTVKKEGTALHVGGVPASISIGDSTGVVATLSDSAGNPLAGKSVFFIVHDASNTFTRSVIADYQGNAPLGALPLPLGSYTVDAYFGGTIPLSTPLQLSDPYYISSSSLGGTLNIVPPPDLTPPTITASATKADSTPYTAGTWTNQTVTVHFTCSDADSGIATCPADQSFSTDGTFNASGTATDHAGNTASASFGPIKIDKTAPALSPVVSPNPVLLNGSATVTPGATDPTSGVASQSCGTLVTSSVGSKTVTCTATDNAGNTASVSVPYRVIYRFDGFLQPINDVSHPQICAAPCSISIFKGGSTVPTKFQLKDANGNVVQASSLPLWVTPQKGSATTAGVDESVYSLPGTTGPTYLWSTDQYIYNWSTKGFAAGYYWRIGVTLDDGQTYFVTVGLK